jgi:hypothetical protein
MAWVAQPQLAYVIYYASGSWNGTGWTWSPGIAVASQAGVNTNPALVQLQNGTIVVFFAYKATGSQQYQLYSVKSNLGSWSRQYSPVPLVTPTSLNDTQPSATVSKDGTLLLVWTRDNSTLAGTSAVMRQLWYKTMKSNVWSTEQPLTSANDVNWNFQPSVNAGKDGNIRVAYSRGQSANDVFQIYYLTYSQNAWGSPVQLTTQTTTNDANPSIMQDRNGTFWVFWARDVNAGGNNTYYQIMDRSSTNNGASWTGEMNLTTTTPDCSNLCVDSMQPAAVQSTTDKNIWVFYSTNPSSTFEIWALKTTKPISPVHDVSMSSFTPNATKIYAGGFYNPYTQTGVPLFESPIIAITVNLQNNGDYNETVTVKLTAANTTNISIGTRTLQMAPGASAMLTFNFNTAGVKPDRYGITANASVPVETLGDRSDGLIFTPDLIHLLPLGDLTQSGSVDISDVTVVFSAYNYSCFTPATCSPQFMSAEWGDVDGSPIIDIVDATVVAHNFNIVT